MAGNNFTTFAESLKIFKTVKVYATNKSTLPVYVPNIANLWVHTENRLLNTLNKI